MFKWSPKVCKSEHSGPDDLPEDRPWLCTKGEGHKGEHAASGVSGRVYATWPQDDK